MALWVTECVHVVINIGEFSGISPIANINSLPINRLVRYIRMRKEHIRVIIIFIFTTYTLLVCVHNVISVCVQKCATIHYTHHMHHVNTENICTNIFILGHVLTKMTKFLCDKNYLELFGIFHGWRLQ